MKSWLFVAVHPLAQEEAALGARIAQRLRARGDTVHLLLTPGLVDPGSMPHTVLVDEAPLQRGLREALSRHRPDAVVLCDLVKTVLHLEAQDAHDALDVDVRVIGIDGWDIAHLQGELDPDTSERIHLARSLVEHADVVRPCPHLYLGRPHAVCVLPEAGPPLSSAQRHQARRDFGPQPLVFVSHPPAPSSAPPLGRLLKPVLEPLDIQVVDVGQRTLHGLGARHSPATPLAVADLLITTSVLDPRVAWAAIQQVPVITLVHRGPTSVDLPRHFQAWPHGFAHTLERLLARNPWAEVLNRAEIGEPEQLQAKVETFLPDSWARDGLVESASAVVERIRELPSPEEELDTLLSS